MGSGKALFEGILQIWSRKPPDIIHPALDSVTVESMHQHFRKVRHNMYTYLEGVPGGSDLEKLVNNYKKIIFSNLFPFQFFCSFRKFSLLETFLYVFTFLPASLEFIAIVITKLHSDDPK